MCTDDTAHANATVNATACAFLYILNRPNVNFDVLGDTGHKVFAHRMVEFSHSYRSDGFKIVSQHSVHSYIS